jgi:hypothetical protein
MKVRGCDMSEASRVFQTLVDEGKLFKDAYGLWHWTKGLTKSHENKDYIITHQEVLETIEFLKKIDLVTVFQTLKVTTLKTKG